MAETERTSLERKVEEVLTACRVVLPGAQALLGFQLAIVLTEAFDRLPSSRYVHLASLGAIALTTVLLIAPAAYHRIVERGEDTPAFLRFASVVLLVSLVTLGLGMAGDLYVVVRKITQSRPVAVSAAVLSLAVLYGAWFGFTPARRRHAAGAQPGRDSVRDRRHAA
jgi:DMSO reductase anchor subunit